MVLRTDIYTRSNNAPIVNNYTGRFLWYTTLVKAQKPSRS